LCSSVVSCPTSPDFCSHRQQELLGDAKRRKLNDHVLLSARIRRTKTQKGTRRLVYRYGEFYGAMYPLDTQPDEAIREVPYDDTGNLLEIDLVFSDVRWANAFVSDFHKHVVKYGDHLTYVDGNGATVELEKSFSKAEYQYTGFLTPVNETHYRTKENQDSPPDDVLSEASHFQGSNASTLADGSLRLENKVVETWHFGFLQSAHIVPAAVCQKTTALRFLDSDINAKKMNRFHLTETSHILFDGKNKMKSIGMSKDNMPQISFESVGDPREIVDANGKDLFKLELQLWCVDEDTATFMARRFDDCSKCTQQCGALGPRHVITGLFVHCASFMVPKMKNFNVKDEDGSTELTEVECKLPSPSGDSDLIDFKSDAIRSVDVLLACLKWRHARVCTLWAAHSG